MNDLDLCLELASRSC